MSRIDRSRLKVIEGDAKIGAHALEPRLLDLAKHYKRSVAKRYRLLNAEDIKLRIREPEMYCSVKVDGQFSYLYRDADEIFIFNYSGRVITGIPALADAEAVLAKFDRFICPCELYCPDDENRSRVFDVANALGSGGEALQRLKLAVYDVLEVNGESYRDKPYSDVDAFMVEHLPLDGRFHRCETSLVSVDGIASLFNDWVVRGKQEGLIARSAEHQVFKIKPRHNVDVAVVGFTERPDAEGTISCLLTALMRPDGTYQILTRVGTGFSESLRTELYDMLKPLEIPSLYKEADGNHTLFTMVQPVFVAEIAFLDLITELGDGQPVMKAVLAHDERGYDVRMPEPFMGAIAPIFVRLRDDKQVCPTDLRLAQMQPFVELDNLDRESRTQDMAASEIRCRKVYAKESRGMTSVRKFVSWKTNKDEIDPSYPAYVFCFVDYSPGRKKPLQKTLRVSSSPDQIDAIFADMEASQVKKGWELVADGEAAGS